MVYLPMSYVYGSKAQVPENDLVRELRTELFLPSEPYEKVDWASHRDHNHPSDIYRGHSFLLDWGHVVLNKAEILLNKVLVPPPPPTHTHLFPGASFFLSIFTTG
jgi:hypothetical protein